MTEGQWIVTGQVTVDEDQRIQAGKLMLVQGLVDENVHARHTMRLIEALTTAARDYQFVLFPEARHMPRNPAHLEYLERQLVEFLNRHLEQGSMEQEQ